MKKISLLVAGVLLGMMVPTDVNAADAKYKEYQAAGYQIVNVADYGADATGNTDVSSAVNKAISVACEAENKAVIYFPTGNYKLSGGMRCDNDIPVIAEADAVIKGTIAVSGTEDGSVVDGGVWKGNSKKGTTGIGLNAGQNLTLKNATIEGFDIGIRATAAELTMEGCTVKNCPDVGLVLYKKANATVNGSRFTKNGMRFKKSPDKGHGIGIYDNSNLVISNSTIEKSHQCGISLSPGKVTLKNCKVKNNGRHGIGTRNACTVKATKTEFSKNGYRKCEVVFGNHGVMIAHGSKGTFENCKFKKNKNMGIWINSGDKGQAGKGNCNVTVKKTTFDNNGRFPIGIDTYYGKQSLTVRSCNFKNHTHGIFINAAGGKYKVKFKGKNIKNKTQYKYMLVQNGKQTFKKW